MYFPCFVLSHVNIYITITNFINRQILTIIDHLTGWPEAFPIPNKKADTVIYIFISNYLPVHMWPRYLLSDNGVELKNQLMDGILHQPAINHISSTQYHI